MRSLPNRAYSRLLYDGIVHGDLFLSKAICSAEVVSQLKILGGLRGWPHILVTPALPKRDMFVSIRILGVEAGSIFVQSRPLKKSSLPRTNCTQARGIFS